MKVYGQMNEQTKNMMSDKIKKEYNNIAVWDLTFYRLDDNGNELKDDNGKVITYRAETDCTYEEYERYILGLADGLDIDDLEVITDER